MVSLLFDFTLFTTNVPTTQHPILQPPRLIRSTPVVPPTMMKLSSSLRSDTSGASNDEEDKENQSGFGGQDADIVDSKAKSEVESSPSSSPLHSLVKSDQNNSDVLDDQHNGSAIDRSVLVNSSNSTTTAVVDPPPESGGPNSTFVKLEDSIVNSDDLRAVSILSIANHNSASEINGDSNGDQPTEERDDLKEARTSSSFLVEFDPVGSIRNSTLKKEGEEEELRTDNDNIERVKSCIAKQFDDLLLNEEDCTVFGSNSNEKSSISSDSEFQQAVDDCERSTGETGVDREGLNLNGAQVRQTEQIGEENAACHTEQTSFEGSNCWETIEGIDDNAEDNVPELQVPTLHVNGNSINSADSKEGGGGEVEDEKEVAQHIPESIAGEIGRCSMTEEKFLQEISDLKLELNAAKQANSKLQLEIGKKDEIVLKTQAEALKKEQQYQQDIKALKEQLREKTNLNEMNVVKDLEEALKEAKTREAQALSELNARMNDELNYRKIMEEYEKTIAARVADCQKLKEENETITRHLANLELSFSDVHQKYERTKTIIHGFKSNEDLLRKKFADFEEIFHKQEEKYESLKAHAKAQIEKSNKEIMQHKERYDDDVNKLRAINKRLEIKISALETSLDQKVQECLALAALCDEVTGKKV